MNIKIDTTLEDGTLSEQLGFTHEFFQQKLRIFFKEFVEPKLEIITAAEAVKHMGLSDILTRAVNSQAPVGVRLKVRESQMAQYIQDKFTDEEILFIALSTMKDLMEPMVAEYVQKNVPRPDIKEKPEEDGKSTV